MRHSLLCILISLIGEIVNGRPALLSVVPDPDIGPSNEFEPDPERPVLLCIVLVIADGAE
jgi:hypothetical protein